MKVLEALGVVAATGLGGYLGSFIGIVLCPDWGDIGAGAMAWGIGGSVVGALVGAGAGVLVLT